MKNRTVILITAGLLLLLTGCSQQPSELHYGSDECAYCKMMITDGRFAAQAVTGTGKSIKFDAVECMAAYAGEHKTDLETARYWVSDFEHPGSWIDLEQATLIQSEVIKSPMGASLLALESEEAVNRHLADYPGHRVSWQQIVK